MRFLLLLLALVLVWVCHASATHRSTNSLTLKRQLLQDLVTWDQHSLFVRGERVMIYSGEFHPFRLPSPGLWLDVFRKIKAMGFTGVSFYTDWGLLEGGPGHVYTEGVWSLDQFFAAASEAGIYLIAHPGPTAAGSMLGWTLRLNGTLRSTSPDYLNATTNYLSTLDRLRDAGIVVPFAVNDNENKGYFATGSGLGAVDIYGIDVYPFRYDCGSGDGWGGVGEDRCAILVNNEGVRVIFKNNYSFGVTIFNTYMIYGGTNWGNLGHHGGYASYDYRASITEDHKLQTNFFKISPAYLTATAGNGNWTKTNFYVAKHADFTFTGNASYTLTVSISIGNVTISQLGGTLLMIRRDSNIHITDFDVGGINLVYSTADIYTWTGTSGSGRVLVIYSWLFCQVAKVGAAWVINWEVTTAQLPAPAPIGNYSSMSKSMVIVKAGNLLRSAFIDGPDLHLTGDSMTSIIFNGAPLHTTKSSSGSLIATVDYKAPEIVLPDFSNSSCEWKYHDSLPELSSTYDDSLWTACLHTTTTNPTILGSWAGTGSNQTWVQNFPLPSSPQTGENHVFTILIDHMGQDEEAPGTDVIEYPRGLTYFSLSGHSDLNHISWKIRGNLGGEQYPDLARGPRNEGAMFAERMGWHLPTSPTQN
ncbi:hypothetical protein BDZ45DRAFT_708844 [Acephala macrosclerotiorum]|nr:hypothetical protein BDZ45DRAFT_708844 [Acephala macrosclerotiorum]